MLITTEYYINETNERMIIMVRISKDPEIRKNEIIDVAKKLFINQGYDNTTVDSIVNEVGVAKGTFYYYFNSKESIIKAIVERELYKGKKQADKILDNTDLNAVKKMEKVMRLLIIPTSKRKDVFHCIDSGNNAKIHQKRDEIFHKIFKKIILKIVEEGVEAGLFKCKYYQDITEIVFIGIDRFMHINMKNYKNRENFSKKVMAIQELLEKSLGLEEGSFNIIV